MEKTTGELIKAARKKAGLTQAELGAKLNITPAAISQFEKPSSNPTFETLEKISNALGCKISELCERYDIVQVQPDITKIIDRYDSHKMPNDQKTDNDFFKTQTDSSYEHSYSYASSAEELDRLQDAKQIELEKKRAKPFKLHETDEEGPPKPFTRPLQSSYDKPNEDYQDDSLKLHTNTRGIDWEQLDDFRFDELMLKLDRGEDLTPAEINFKSAYLERCLKKIGHIFAKFYSMLNVEGQKKADEQIDRAIEQVELLTKIPEYQKKPDNPPQE